MSNEQPSELESAAAEFEKQLTHQEEIIGDMFQLIYAAGLMDEMSQRSRDYVADSPWIQEVIKRAEGPKLNMRLSYKEYVQHLARIMHTPPAQLEFLEYIVKSCYVMMMSEKNPMVAQELRGVSNITNALEGVLRS